MQAGQSAGDEAARSLRAAENYRRKAAWHEERAASYARGRRGEIAVAQALDELDRDGYLRIDDCRWPGRPKANIDHVLIGPAGLFVIDAKNWSGKVDVRNGLLRQNGYRRAREVDAVGAAARAVSALLPFAVPRAEGALCLAGEARLPVTRFGAITVASAAEIVGWLRSQPAVLRPEAVGAAYTALLGALRPPHHGAAASHVPSVPDYVPSRWPSGAVVREPAFPQARPTSRGTTQPPDVTTGSRRFSRRAALMGRILLVLLSLDGIGSAVFGHSQQVGAAFVAVACVAWLVRLEARRPVVPRATSSRPGRRRR